MIGAATRALVAALSALATGVSAQFPMTMELRCLPAAETGGRTAAGPNLSGLWDFVIAIERSPNFGLMSIGPFDGGYAGSLTPSLTAPVAIRRFTVSGSAVHFAVASREGDVLFDGTVSAGGNTMCGIVTYHTGSKFPMIARRRPQQIPASE